MDYTTIDNKIVGAIEAGRNSFSAIFLHLNHGKNFKTDPDFVPERTIDKRLQALRRKGRIVFTGSHTRSGWKLNQEPTT